MEHQKHESEAFNHELNGFEFALFVFTEYLCTMEFHNSQV